MTAVTAAEAHAKEANEKLAAAMVTMEQRFTHYQPYWVEGLGGDVGQVLGAAEAGVPLRGAVWVHVDPDAPAPGQPAPGAEGGAGPVGPAAGGEGQEAPIPAPPPVPPALWSELRQAAGAADWDGVAGRLVTLELELPPCPAPPPPVEVDTKKKGAAAAKKPDPKKKGAVEEPTPPPTPPPDAPGWEALGALLAGLCRRVRAYDEWRGRVKVYDATQPEAVPSTAYYEALLDSVAPERLSVPVLLHAVLEQVTRNAQGEEAVAESEEALAQSWALAALEDALGGLGLDDEGAGGQQGVASAGALSPGTLAAGPGAIFKPAAPASDAYSIVVEGDVLGAAAVGLTTGYVHPHVPTGHAAQPGVRPPSPTSILEEGVQTPPLQEASGGDGAVARPAAPSTTVGVGLPMFLPGTGVQLGLILDGQYVGCCGPHTHANALTHGIRSHAY